MREAGQQSDMRTGRRSDQQAGQQSAKQAGYSGTPLHRKLGVKPGHRVLAVDSPPGWDLAVLDPEGAAELTAVPLAELSTQLPRLTPLTPLTPLAPLAPLTPLTPLAEAHDVVLVFCPDAAALAAALPAAMASTTLAGRCWVAWPKKSSPLWRDLTEDDIRGAALAVGWVDVKVCAVDAVWSGLCLVRRLENR